MFLYLRAYNRIVRLGFKALDGQDDGQCRQHSSHAPEHSLNCCLLFLFKLVQLVYDSKYALLEVCSQSAIEILGLAGFCVADT